MRDKKHIVGEPGNSSKVQGTKFLGLDTLGWYTASGRDNHVCCLVEWAGILAPPFLGAGGMEAVHAHGQHLDLVNV
jgi:hypothetical protein